MKERQNLSDIEKRKFAKLYSAVKNLKDKDWYGMVLLIIVAALILLLTLIQFTYDIIEPPLVIINVGLFVAHLLLVYLSFTDKLTAYCGGLIVFFVLIVLNVIMGGKFHFGMILWILAIVGSYLIFIYEAYKLKKLEIELSKLD